MTWLLKLYPPRWRRRYGAELADLVAAQPFSIGAAVDLLAGALDAWLHPQLATPALEMKGEVSMIARMMQLKCAGYGSTVTANDKAKNTAINIGGTLVLALLWLALVWVWKNRQFGGNTYLMAVSPMTYLIPYLIGLRYTSLKGRSPHAQMITIVGFGAALTMFLLFVAWVGTRI